MNNTLNIVNIRKIHSVHYYELSANYHFDGEAHDFWEMVYVDFGEIIITSDKEKILLKQGEAFFHEPNEFHAIDSSDKTAANIFILTFHCTSKAMAQFKKRKIQLPPKYHHISLIMRIARETYKLSIRQDTNFLILNKDTYFGGPQMLLTYMELMLIMIIRDQHSADNKSPLSYVPASDNKYIAAVLELLNDNIYNRISVDKICRILDVSRVYLSKLFKETTGYTISEYYSILKVNEAKKLIVSGKYNLSQISDMLSFNNPHYFSRVFKRTTGISPKEYKN